MHDRRAQFREGLHELFLPYYDDLCVLLPPEWQPYSGDRTFEHQDRLYAQGRTLPGGIVTNARSGESPHNYGMATDWVIWDEQEKPVWIKKDDPRWEVFVEAVKAVKLKAGADFGDVDHCELRISCSWKEIGKTYKTEGLDAALQKIKDFHY